MMSCKISPTLVMGGCTPAARMLWQRVGVPVRATAPCMQAGTSPSAAPAQRIDVVVEIIPTAELRTAHVA